MHLHLRRATAPKANVALGCGARATTGLSREYGVHLNQIRARKRPLLCTPVGVFVSGMEDQHDPNLVVED